MSCTMLALCSGAARGQDSARVPDTNPDASAAVDASVHAGIDEQSAQPQPPKQPNKRPAPYARWAFQSANQPSTTRFRSSQSLGLLSAQPPTGDDTPSSLFNPLTRSEIPSADILPRGPNTPFRISFVPRTTEPYDPHAAAVRAMVRDLNSENATSIEDPKTKNTLPSPSHRNDNFSTKKPEPAENSLFPSPFLESGRSNSTSRKKRNPPKSIDRSKSASSLGSPSRNKIN